MNEFHARRSMLYVPGSNERALNKAGTLGADMVAFDLEDAVGPRDKTEARRQVDQVLTRQRPGGCAAAVRINGLDTEWGPEDLSAFAASSADALLVPKVNCADDLVPIQKALDQAGSKARIWAMLETPLAVLNAQAIAASSRADVPGLSLFVMGLNDLALEMRLRPGTGREGLRPALSHCILAARAYGLDIIDGVYNRFDDEAGFRTECEEGRRLGFDGKSLIHPAQIAPCHQTFAPSDDEIAQARKILLASEGYEAESHGAIAIDGVMVEALHVEAARRVLAQLGEK